MKLTKDFLVAKGACPAGRAWFLTHFGDEADYQTVLNKLAAESRCNWAEWLLSAVGPITDVMELTAETKIEGDLFVAGSLKCTRSLSVTLSIKAGGGIEAGWDFGIYCGLSICTSMKAERGHCVAKTRPNNLLLGEYVGDKERHR